MTSRKTYAYTEGTPQTLQKNETLSYRTDGWKDQLVSWNGYRYVYDAGGNPTLLRGVPLTWGEGRRLKRVSISWGTVDFAYDSDGKRVRKTSGGNTTTYYYNGNVLSGLVRRAVGSTGAGTTVQFVYDTQGKPFMLRLNGKTDYFYLYNGLGDVVGLVDSSNQVVVRYQYNSWGKVTSTQDTSGVSLATLNPFRYRKYVYDPETGLYCLGSRYYDPEVGRFVNADDFETLTYQMDSVQGKNLYQYCFNNPVNMEDEDGGWPKWVTQVLVGTAVIAAAAVLTVATAGTGTALACFAVGALKGAALGAASGAVNGAITGVIGNRIATGSWSGSAAAALNGAAEGYMSGAITGFVVGGVTSNVCFVAGTLVHLVDRDTEIENVSVGDLVWAENPETNEKALKRVVRTFCNQSDELVQIRTPQEEITATPTHPFYVKGKGWVRAGDLQHGDRLCLRNGKYTQVVLIHRKKLKTTVSVYNFEVEDFHTYYVGIQGILVHNKCIVEENGVKIESYYPNDHGNPTHLHVKGGGKPTKIGPQGYPVKGYPNLSVQQAAVVRKYLPIIKKK